MITSMGIPAACSSGGDDGGANERMANVFFSRGREVASEGNAEYAIEMFLQGLLITPENVDAHEALRTISLRRKADGGKNLGLFEKRRLRSVLDDATDDRQAMITAEKLLAYDPSNVDWMVAAATHASTAGLGKAAGWFAQLARELAEH